VFRASCRCIDGIVPRRVSLTRCVLLICLAAPGCGRVGYDLLSGPGDASVSGSGGTGAGGLGGSSIAGSGGSTIAGSGGSSIAGSGGSSIAGTGGSGATGGTGVSGAAGRGGTSGSSAGGAGGSGAGGTGGAGGSGAGGAGGTGGAGGSGAGGTGGAGGSGAGGAGGAGGSSAGGTGGLAGASCTPATYGGHAYAFCFTPLPWSSASNDCSVKGMRLARIDDAAENAWMQSIAFANVPDVSSQYWPWIGGTDLAVVGEWRWTDGALFWLGGSNGAAQGGLYENWVAGSPTTNGAATDCAILQHAGFWTDYDCDRLEPYVCEQY